MVCALRGVMGSVGLAMAACATAQVPVSVDGVFNEWSPTDMVATDPVGDGTGNFDVTALSARNEGTILYLRFTTDPPAGPELNLPSGSASDGTLVVRVGFPGGGSVSVDFRARRLFQNDNSGNTVSWSTVGFLTAPTFSATEFEMQIDLGPLGVSTGSQVSINFSGSDTLSSPASYTMSAPPMAPVRRSAARDPGAAFRIVSLNTKRSGLISTGTRIAQFSRLVSSMAAEVYCFQEEYNSTAGNIASFLQSANPLNTGAAWSVHKNNDVVIAVDSSVGSIIGVPESDTSFSSAVVDFGGGNAVLVFSIHPKCCGFIGSTEDTRRINQMNALIGTLANFRAGNMGGQLAPFAAVPVVVLGDWNLVGSSAPLTLLESPAGANLVELPVKHLIGEETISWIGGNSSAGSFWPGRLDLITHSATGITPLKQFMLNTAELNSSELTALGLQSGDSGATDHLMVVADFGFGVIPPFCVGDANGDGTVDFADITSVVSNWLTAGPAGDANGDGTVDFADITSVVSNWLVACP